MCAVFDNEETGSLTRQGADSPFLSDVLERISLSSGKSREEHLRAIARGMMLSADNAHAVHPDSPEKSDPTSRCCLNGGVVVKHSPRYATDALTAGPLPEDLPEGRSAGAGLLQQLQDPQGGTLGNLSRSTWRCPQWTSAWPQLSMHSPMKRRVPGPGIHGVGHEGVLQRCHHCDRPGSVQNLLKTFRGKIGRF